jgi:hypothetical protein
MKQNLCSLIEKDIPHPQSCLECSEAKEKMLFINENKKMLFINENITIFLLRRKRVSKRERVRMRGRAAIQPLKASS